MRDSIGSERCTFGMPAVMAMLDDQGNLNPTIGRQKTQHSDQRWVDLFIAAGMPSAYEPEMLLWLRSHVPFTAAMESICVAGKRRNGGATWNEAIITARGVHGGFAIIEALGYRIYPRSKSAINSWPTFIIASMLWMMSRIKTFRDLLGQGLDESRQLIDAMVHAAARTKSPVTGAIADVIAMKPAIPA